MTKFAFVSAERPQYRKDRCALTPFPAAITGIVYGRGNVVLATGYDVRTKLLRITSDRLMVMRNMYAVRLKELLGLLEHVAAILAESAPLPSPWQVDPGSRRPYGARPIREQHADQHQATAHHKAAACPAPCSDDPNRPRNADEQWRPGRPLPY